ncbi:MAG TPA: hypothetical protein VGX96_12530, partial [Candidatus Elarobacter sp.]|nr:hypothetical protein [Candidatus Elarobacter sp.]
RVGLVGDTQASVTPLRGTLGANDQVVTGDNSSKSGSSVNTNTRNLLNGGGGGGGSRGGGRGPGG